MADIGVLPSKFEQCSYTVLEMMCHRLPMLIGASPGVIELIDPQKTCGVFNITSGVKSIPVIDEEDFYKKIKMLLYNKDLQFLYKERAFDVWCKSYTNFIMAKNTISCYLE